MTEKQLEKNNINNLTNLFKTIGTKSWPKRLWADYEYERNDIKILIHKVLKEDSSYLIPLWDKQDENSRLSSKLLEENEFDVSYEQIGMVLDVNMKKSISNNDLTIRFIGSKKDIDTWVNVASSSFTYPIISEVIYEISKNENIDLLLVYKDGTAIGTALIFTNSNVVGVHFLSVLPSFSGNEILKNIIEEITAFAKREQVGYLTLLSSNLSFNTYKDLGFQKQFVLKNYIKK